MILATMSFGGYEWKVNPTKIEILSSAQKNSVFLPFENTKVSSLYKKPIVYKGVGEFAGGDCLVRYRELEKLFAKGKKAILCIPDMPPVYAWFTGLTLVGDTTEDLLRYTFEFTQAEASFGGFVQKYHICKEGETLYDIAFDYDISIGKLIELNSFIRRPDELEAGERVRLC